MDIIKEESSFPLTLQQEWPLMKEPLVENGTHLTVPIERWVSGSRPIGPLLLVRVRTDILTGHGLVGIRCRGKWKTHVFRYSFVCEVI